MKLFKFSFLCFLILPLVLCSPLQAQKLEVQQAGEKPAEVEEKPPVSKCNAAEIVDVLIERAGNKDKEQGAKDLKDALCKLGDPSFRVREEAKRAFLEMLLAAGRGVVHPHCCRGFPNPEEAACIGSMLVQAIAEFARDSGCPGGRGLINDTEIRESVKRLGDEICKKDPVYAFVCEAVAETHVGSDKKEYKTCHLVRAENYCTQGLEPVVSFLPDSKGNCTCECEIPETPLEVRPVEEKKEQTSVEPSTLNQTLDAAVEVSIEGVSDAER